MRQDGLWRVGELARQTGLTVRTLHHYDDIGLLTASRRSEAGYRLYTSDDVARLQQIRSLKSLGFSLEEIRDYLRQPDPSPQAVIRLQLERLHEQMALMSALRQRLEALVAWLDSAQEVPAAAFLHTIEVMNMIEQYYTPEQLAELQTRREQVGEERIRQVESEWPELIAQVREAMAQGLDPTAAPVQALAQRWMALVAEFTGGNPAIEQSLQRMYTEEPAVRQQAGIDPAMFAYVQQAMTAARAQQG